MAFVFNANYLAVNLAINLIIDEFQSKLSIIQWILSGYMLAWALLVIPAGKILDRYSCKTMATGAIVLLLLASIGGGLSFNASSIIIARIIQGISAALFVQPCIVHI